ncbi:hypothetical protein KY308_01020, partial [Candidatus Woesearchaeota archaeon]|nr:hypothetical protein [Candidatus Woesearchaeota archaeon]
MSYFHSKNGIEYDLLLEALRTKVPLATKKHYPNVECIIDGTLPKELQKYLPIFGLDDSEKAEHYALNSGGRGIILSNGKKHFRFKGNDLDSSITKSVAKARNNVINDINLTARDMQDVEFDTNSLKNGGFFVPPLHGSKPFSFFTKESVENE